MELDQVIASELKTVESAHNYLRERINAVKASIRSQPPPPTYPLNGAVYLTWERTTMIKYGQAIGAIQALQAFGVISVQAFNQYKTELIGVLLQTTASVQLGTQTP
jgi:hypothetical protein